MENSKPILKFWKVKDLNTNCVETCGNAMSTHVPEEFWHEPTKNSPGPPPPTTKCDESRTLKRMQKKLVNLTKQWYDRYDTVIRPLKSWQNQLQVQLPPIQNKWHQVFLQIPRPTEPCRRASSNTYKCPDLFRCGATFWSFRRPSNAARLTCHHCHRANGFVWPMALVFSVESSLTDFPQRTAMTRESAAARRSVGMTNAENLPTNCHAMNQGPPGTRK